MWVAQPAATRGDEAKATGCSFLFHTATRYLSISGEWNGTGLRFGVPPTIHGSWSDEQQEATSDNVVLRADGGLTFNELPRATPEWLEAFAVRSTADLGDPYPDHVRFDLDPDVVRVELRGAFTCDRACTYPAGAKPPTGTRAVYTIDARSHVVDSFSLGH
jgi:hypothetical protein